MKATICRECQSPHSYNTAEVQQNNHWSEQYCIRAYPKAEHGRAEFHKRVKP